MPRQILTVGHDAELFLYDENNNAYPSVGLVGGSKQCPREVKGGAVQEDNVMAEINIEPATTSKQFLNRTNQVLESLTTILKAHGLTYKLMDFENFEPEFLKSAQAKVFGCDPDYNVYTLEQNVVDSSELKRNNIRTAGGHIHVGLSDPDFHPMARASIVKGCDFYIGLPLTVLECESRRKAFYGKAGSFRRKEYGIEYRTPSNIWLSTDYTKQWIFHQVKLIIGELTFSLPNDEPTRYERSIREIGENTVQDIINSGLVDDAHDLCQNYGIEIPTLERE